MQKYIYSYIYLKTIRNISIVYEAEQVINMRKITRSNTYYMRY